MSQTIDVTGLAPEAVRVVESLVGMLRESQNRRMQAARSIFDLFGMAPQLRTGEEIAQQVQAERDAWRDS